MVLKLLPKKMMACGKDVFNETVHFLNRFHWRFWFKLYTCISRLIINFKDYGVFFSFKTTDIRFRKANIRGLQHWFLIGCAISTAPLIQSSTISWVVSRFGCSPFSRTQLIRSNDLLIAYCSLLLFLWSWNWLKTNWLISSFESLWTKTSFGVFIFK